MLDFLKTEALGMPYWGWFACALGVACLLIVIIIVTCCVKRGKGEAGQEGSAEEGDKAEVKEEEKKETASEEVKASEKKEEKSSSTKASEKKEEKAAAKSTEKKEEPAKKEESSSNDTKVYHISKRKEDGKWQVKAEGADRALRLFFTQADAITYAKKVAGNQEGRIVVHKESGGFRKLNY